MITKKEMTEGQEKRDIPGTDPHMYLFKRETEITGGKNILLTNDVGKTGYSQQVKINLDPTSYYVQIMLQEGSRIQT